MSSNGRQGGLWVSLLRDTSDVGLVEICQSADKLGIDCPFGWPEPFVEAIAAHASHEPWPGHGLSPDEYRRKLSLRTTDLHVAQTLKKTPLPVSADRIGRTAMRCALLLDKLPDVDRSGAAGKVAGVYPGVARVLGSQRHRLQIAIQPRHARLAPGRAQGAAPLAELRRRGA